MSQQNYSHPPPNLLMILCTIGISLPLTLYTTISPTCVSVPLFQRNSRSPLWKAGSMLPESTTTIGEEEFVKTERPFHSMNAVERTRAKFRTWAASWRGWRFAIEPTILSRSPCVRECDERVLWNGSAVLTKGCVPMLLSQSIAHSISFQRPLYFRELVCLKGQMLFRMVSRSFDHQYSTSLVESSHEPPACLSIQFATSVLPLLNAIALTRPPCFLTLDKQSQFGGITPPGDFITGPFYKLYIPFRWRDRQRHPSPSFHVRHVGRSTH